MAEKEMKMKEDKIKARPKGKSVSDGKDGPRVVKQLTDELVSAWRGGNSGADSGDHPAAKAMAELPAFTYKYKEGQQDPNAVARADGQDDYVGPMAQDMLKNRVTSPAVLKGEDGLLRVDTGRLTLGNTAALSDLARQVEELKALQVMNRENTMSGEELDARDELDKIGQDASNAMRMPQKSDVAQQDFAELREAIRGLRTDMPQGGSDPLARTEPQAPPTARFPDLAQVRRQDPRLKMSDIFAKKVY